MKEKYEQEKYKIYPPLQISNVFVKDIFRQNFDHHIYYFSFLSQAVK